MKFLGLFFLAVLSTHVLAVPTLDSFSPSTTISSSAVNSNFTILKTSVEALETSNAGLYIFPIADGSSGQVLTTDGAGNLSWQPSGGGGGMTSLNGDNSTTQFFAMGSAGMSPAWSSGGGTHTLNIPSASSAAVTAGLISNSDYSTFAGKLSNMNGFAQGGNTFGASAQLGTNDANALIFKTNGVEKLRIDPSGNVGVGTASPTGTLHVQNTSNNTDATATMFVSGSLDAAFGEQYGAKIVANINQASTASYTGLEVVVVETTLGTGTKKLIDAQVGASSKFTVDNNGFFTASGFMGALNTNTNVTCYTAPAINDHTQITALTLDFGAFSGALSVASTGVYEILVDAPYTVLTGTVMGASLLLTDGTAEVYLSPGRNVKRLTSGSWQLRLGCLGSGAVASFQAATSVFGIRKLH